MCNKLFKKVAVVTGSNKGIGFAIVKGLLQNNYPGIVYLTSRDESNGLNAIKLLQNLGLNACYHQLDINDIDSVNQLARDIEVKHGGIDLLINNAAIKYSSKSTESHKNIVINTLETNYYGTKRVCKVLFPLLNKHAQVINVSSAAGHVSVIPDPDLRRKFTKNITIEELEHILTDYINLEDNYTTYQWKNMGYVLSKVAICAFTVAQQKLFNEESAQRCIRINSVHPGYVNTDMTQGRGIQSPEDGAKSALFLALNDEHDYRGDFIWYNCKRVDWLSDTMPNDIKP